MEAKSAPACNRELRRIPLPRTPVNSDRMAAGGAKNKGVEEACVDVRQEIPVKSFSIAAYVCRVVSGRGRYLVIRRSTPYLRGTWQMISGAV